MFSFRLGSFMREKIGVSEVEIGWRPESDNSLLYFSDCSMVFLISDSIIIRGRVK